MFGWIRRKVLQIDVPLDDGSIKKINVSESEFDDWRKKGWISRIVAVNALDDGAASGADLFLKPRAYPFRRVTWKWVVGEDIDQASYDRFKDADGNLHALTYYEKGQKMVGCVTKQQYDEACNRHNI